MSGIVAAAGAGYKCLLAFVVEVFVAVDSGGSPLGFGGGVAVAVVVVVVVGG